MIKEFKEFISKGNVMDMAVGIIIGGAFTKIVTALVEAILMPFIGIICGGKSVEDMSVMVGNASIGYGAFLQAIIDFLKENDVRPPQVNLLPYHSTGSHKYGKLGRDYLAEEMTTPTDEEMQSFVKQWNDAGFANVKIGG